jgi:biopolymer transport protein ExbD
MTRKKRIHEQVSFNITPMIDMTFLLLIFFMVTSKLSNEKMKMDIALPQARVAKLTDATGDRDIINVDGKGNYYVGNTMVTKKQLKAHLTDRFKANPPLKIYLRADKNTPSKMLKEFMAMAAEAGAVTVLIGTYKS